MPILHRPGERLALLNRSRTVALVGMSSRRSRASHFVATYLLGSTDFEVWFVNPREREVLGRPVHPSIAALPAVPDIVDVFRRQEELGDVADAAIEAGATALWFQLGLRDDDAATRAADAGLAVVQDRCLKIEHARFAGGLHTAGFDTGVLDSRRTKLVHPVR